MKKLPKVGKHYEYYGGPVLVTRVAHRDGDSLEDAECAIENKFLKTICVAGELFPLPSMPVRPAKIGGVA